MADLNLRPKQGILRRHLVGPPRPKRHLDWLVRFYTTHLRAGDAAQKFTSCLRCCLNSARLNAQYNAHLHFSPVEQWRRV